MNGSLLTVLNPQAASLAIDCRQPPPSPIQTWIHIAATPLRCGRVALAGIQALVHELTGRSWRELPRVIMLICTNLFTWFLHESASWIEPFRHPGLRMTRSVNKPAIREAPTYTHSSLQPDQLSAVFGNQKGRRLTAPITFWHHEQCCGMTLWFLALVENLSKRCPDREKCLWLAASVFENGAPKEAILLQSLASAAPNSDLLDQLIYGNDLSKVLEEFEDMLGSLVGLKIKACLYHARVEIGNLDRAKALFQPARGINGVSLKTGAHLVRRGYPGGHSMVYFKLSSELSYTFNPDVGLMRHIGARHEELAMKAMGLTEREPFFFMQVHAA